MQKIEKIIFKYPFLFITLLAIPAIWALFVKGYFGASDDLHIAWLYEMNNAISQGQFPPRFVPDLSFGFGYPLFNFVFPLPFYLGEIFHLIGFNFVDSIKAVFLISVPLSGYFMFRFLKKFTSNWLSLAGSIVYIFTPYRATDLFVRGAIGEILAFAFVPAVAWGIAESNVLIIALSTAFLILSHNIMAYMFLPFLFVLALIIGLNRKIVIGFVLGLLASVYFWLPAILDSGLMKYDTVFNFYDHFPTLKQLFTPYFGYGASVPGPYDGMSFFIGFINIILLVSAVVLFKKLNKVTLWGLITLLVAIFMMNFRSAFIWKIVPLLPYFQFPWRFLSLTTFATSVLVLIFDKFKNSRLIAIAIIIISIIFNWQYFKPHDFLGRGDSYYLNRYIPVPVASQDYKNTGEEYLRLPKYSDKRPESLSTDIKMHKNFVTDNSEDVVLEYNKYNFPGWEVKVDGVRVQITSGKPYGQIQFNVPKGKHFVDISFKETSTKVILDLISLLAIVIAVTIEIRNKK